MRQDEITELLRRAVPEATSSTVGQVAAMCGGWPLLATLVGASVSGDVSAGATAQQALELAGRALRAHGPQAFDVWDIDQRKVAISHVISTTLRALDDSVRIPGADDLSERYLSLAVFPPATPIPLEVLSRWWGAAHGWSPVMVRQFCKVLADRSLLTAYRADSEMIVLHDVFRAYLRSLVAHTLPELHRSLLDAMRPAAGWAHLPRARTYEWAHIAYHLAGSGGVRQLAEVLGDARYVIAKATVCGAHTLRADRDLVARAQESAADTDTVALLNRAFRLTSQGYLLHGQQDAPDMAATLKVALAREGIEDDGYLSDSATDAGPRLRWVLPADDLGSASHVGAVVSVAAHGNLLVSGGEDGLVRIWDVPSRRLVRSLQGHTGWVHAVAISPDGSAIASAGEDNVIRLWSADDGAQIGMFPGHEKRIRTLAFRRRAAELVSGAEDGLIRTWDLQTLALARQTSTRGVGIWSLSLSDDETMLAASGEDEYVRLFDLATGDLLDEAALHRSWVRSVQFLPGGYRLASGAADGIARIWDTRGRRLEPQSLLDAAGERLRAVAYHDRRIVTAGENATVRTYGDGAGHVRMPAGITWVRTIASSAHGVAIGCEDGSLRLWDTRESEADVIAPGRNTIWSVSFLNGGETLALGQADGTVRLRDTATGTETTTLTAGTGRVWSLATAGPYLAAACGDGRLRVWRDSEPLLELNDDVLLTWAVAISDDGQHLAASDTTGHVRVWSLPDGALLWDREAKAGRIRSLTASSSAGVVAAAGGDGVVRTWDLATGEDRETISVPGWARAVATDRHGTRLAVGAGSGDIYVYDNESAEPVLTLAGHRGRVLMLGFAEDGVSLVSTAADGTVRRWALDGQGSSQVRVDASAQCAAFHPATGQVAVASSAGAVLLHVADPEGSTA